MALILSVNNNFLFQLKPSSLPNPNSKIFVNEKHHSISIPCFSIQTRFRQRRRLSRIFNELQKDSHQSTAQEEEVNSLGVKAALSMLKFYKREISPLMPNSCRYVPTCSEYSMTAYKNYGVVKGTILTAWRLCRCNPLGGSGFDPPRWFDETSSPE